MQNEEIFDVVIAQVTDINESAQKDRAGKETGKFNSFVRLAGAVTILAVGVEPAKLPANGAIAAFQVKRSRAGKMGLIQAWGWLDAAVKGPISGLADISKLAIDWQAHFNSNGGQVRSGGVTR